jgi:hypothetical protein
LAEKPQHAKLRVGYHMDFFPSTNTTQAEERRGGSPKVSFSLRVSSVFVCHKQQRWCWVLRGGLWPDMKAGFRYRDIQCRFLHSRSSGGVLPDEFRN